jgi:phage tail tape-measure protein
VREGFSLAALIFGVFYFLWHRAWNAVAVDAVAVVAAAVAGGLLGTAAPMIGVIVLQGVLGHDLLRWGLSMHGYVQGPVVAARDEDSALARLLEERHDLVSEWGGAAGVRF